MHSGFISNSFILLIELRIVQNHHSMISSNQFNQLKKIFSPSLISLSQPIVSIYLSIKLNDDLKRDLIKWFCSFPTLFNEIVNPSEQQDAVEFITMFLDRIDAEPSLNSVTGKVLHLIKSENPDIL